MLLPVVQAVLLWYTGRLTECHVLMVRGIVSPFVIWPQLNNTALREDRE